VLGALVGKIEVALGDGRVAVIVSVRDALGHRPLAVCLRIL
jgi:hypothetical protein